MKAIEYRSKSFLFKTHKKYTIKNLIEDEVEEMKVPQDL